jgi:hypothetical protein
MGISGLSKKMSAGRLDNADVMFSGTVWENFTSKNGKDLVVLKTTFIDADGGSHPQQFLLGDQKYVMVDDDGKLESVDNSREYQISATSPVGKLFLSLEDKGFPGSKLDKIGDNPGLLDDVWVHVEQKAGSGTKTDGTAYTDLVVTEILDGPPGGAKGKKKSAAATSTTSTSKKKAAKADEDEEPEEEPDETEESEDEGGDEEDDDLTTATVATAAAIFKSPAKYIKNYDADEPLTLKQLSTAAFTAIPKAQAALKGRVATALGKKDFWTSAAGKKLGKFDAAEGTVTPK